MNDRYLVFFPMKPVVFKILFISKQRERDWNNFASTFKGGHVQCSIRETKKDQKMLIFGIFTK